MVDVSSAKVKKLIVHRIGNKLRDEGFTLSDNEAERTSTLDDLLLKSFLAPVVRQGEVYELHHESDLSLNTIHHYSNLIFSNESSFQSHSQAIAKHLYSASVHPNIGGGEFIEILFDDIRTEDGPRQGLGLFRIEGKNDYLDVMDENGSLRVLERVGISLDKIQKGAVVVSGSTKVFVIDALSQKTKYWLESFLKAVPSATPKACAKAAGAFLKAVSFKVELPGDALEFGQRIQESLSDSDSLSIGTIKDISNSYLDEDEVSGILAGIRNKVGLEISDDLVVDSRQLTRYAKDVVTKARIAEGINLVISNHEAHVASLDIKKTKTGIRATIEIQIKGV
jgi:hypothetical protein